MGKNGKRRKRNRQGNICTATSAKNNWYQDALLVSLDASGLLGVFWAFWASRTDPYLPSVSQVSPGASQVSSGVSRSQRSKPPRPQVAERILGVPGV